MRTRTRLVFLGVSFVALLLVGWIATGSMRFLFTDFWFTAGFLLLLLLSLVDQPHFSRDASIFVNGATAWVSLLLVPRVDRGSFWWVFFAWAMYLVASSYSLMWVRSRVLAFLLYIKRWEKARVWYLAWVDCVTKEQDGLRCWERDVAF